MPLVTEHQPTQGEVSIPRLCRTEKDDFCEKIHGLIVSGACCLLPLPMPPVTNYWPPQAAVYTNQRNADGSVTIQLDEYDKDNYNVRGVLVYFGSVLKYNSAWYPNVPKSFLSITIPRGAGAVRIAGPDTDTCGSFTRYYNFWQFNW